MLRHTFVHAALAVAGLFSTACHAQSNPDALARARQVAAGLASEFSTHCPLAAPGDQEAFNACRQGLFQPDSALRQGLNDFVLWGRQRDPRAALKDTNLTQFGPDVLSGMYLPLFMFNGEHTVRYVESEDLYQVRLRVAFRNRLQPGQFPYPFWHEAEKWDMYQHAKEVLLWWDAKKDRVAVAQFSPHGTVEPLVATQPVAPHQFSGQWMWTDAAGQTQPKVTVFDGLFRADNPYLGQLDGAYKTLALRLREGQCNECHVPNNPDKMKRLVLLQTPAHAGAEIKRLIESVRKDRMPRDEAGIEQPLPEQTKQALLRDSLAFDKLYDAAKQWEAVQQVRSTLAARRGPEAVSR